MELWTSFVDLIYATLFQLSMVFGGNMGLAIGVLSFAFRLALLPLTLRIAYRSLNLQAALKKIEPELQGIRRKYKDDPRRVLEETAKVHQREGITIFEGRSLAGMLVQVPLFIGLFSAVRRGLSGTGRFLWIKDLMASDPLLAFVCAVLTGTSAVLGSNAPEQQRTVTFLLPAALTLSFLLPAALTLFFLWRMSAGVTIYTFSSGLVGLAQSLIIRRRLMKQPA